MLSSKSKSNSSNRKDQYILLLNLNQYLGDKCHLLPRETLSRENFKKVSNKSLNKIWRLLLIKKVMVLRYLSMLMICLKQEKKSFRNQLLKKTRVKKVFLIIKMILKISTQLLKLSKIWINICHLLHKKNLNESNLINQFNDSKLKSQKGHFKMKP